MLDLFLKLMDKLVDVAKERQRVQRALHDDFLEPAMAQFDNVHQSYIESYQDYLHQVASEAPDFSKNNPVFRQLKKDMLFTHASRQKLRSKADSLYSLPATQNDALNSLVWDVAQYALWAGSGARADMANAIRGSLRDELMAIAKGQSCFYHDMSASEAAEKEITEKVLEMQDRYSEIQLKYERAKTELLS